MTLSGSLVPWITVEDPILLDSAKGFMRLRPLITEESATTSLKATSKQARQLDPSAPQFHFAIRFISTSVHHHSQLNSRENITGYAIELNTHLLGRPHWSGAEGNCDGKITARGAVPTQRQQ